MSSVYDNNDKFLGQRVENLTDGPTDELMGFPYGTLGKVAPARGVCEFQNDIYDAIPYYGLRTVYHRVYGTVKQALVMSIGSLAWINIG